LFYRLNVIPIEMPPLRNRRETSPPSEHRPQAPATHGAADRPHRRSVRDKLAAYERPGNVREPRNIGEPSCLTNGVITAARFPVLGGHWPVERPAFLKLRTNIE
jgi:transcriptional regulator with GAF, ATPase, and Fis domain